MLRRACKPPLKTCIPLKSRFYNLIRLSLAEYSLYSGFVVYSFLHVLVVVKGFGLLSQTHRRSKLTSEENVEGQDVVPYLLFIVIHCVEPSLKTLFIFPLLFVNYCKLKTLQYFASAKLWWMLYDSAYL